MNLSYVKMNAKEILLNLSSTDHATSFGSTNQSFSNNPERAFIIQLNDTNSCQYQLCSCMNKPQQSQTVVPLGNNLGTKKVPLSNSDLNFVSHINLDHDYVKKTEHEAKLTTNGNSFLTINLTEYSKVLDVKEICGVILLLKKNSTPLHSNKDDTSETNINVPQSDSISEHNAQVQEFDQENCRMPSQSEKNEMNIIDSNPTLNSHSEMVSRSYKNSRSANESSTDVTDSILRKALEKHKGLKCQTCGKLCRSKKILYNHYIRIHEKITFKCSECPKQYKWESALARHQARMHDINCEFCEATFKIVVDYKKHLKESHKEVFPKCCKPYYCEDCDSEFTNKDGFMKHLRDHTGFLCNICLERFSNKEEYRAHKETHPTKYFCEICNKGFREKVSLEAHSGVHNDPYSVICPKCGKGFKTKSTLRHHMFTHNPQELFMCDRCSKLYRTKKQLIEHQKCVHDKIRNIQCPVCEKKFFSQYGCKFHHDMVHLKLKPYQCEFCGKQFGRKDFLLCHRKIHTREHMNTGEHERVRNLKAKLRKSLPSYSKEDNEKPVDCPICGTPKKNLFALKLHLNTHARIRKFKCRYCGLMFLQQTSKIRHERSHEADPVHKFICPVCWKRTDTKEKLDAHIEEHNNRPKRYICEECGKAFCRRMLLDNHMLSEHPTKEDLSKKEEEFILKCLKQALDR